ILERTKKGGVFLIEDEKYNACIKEIKPNYIQVAINKDCFKFTLSTDKENNTIVGLSGHNFKLKRNDILIIPDFYETAMVGSASDIVKSPMPGKVIKVFVQVGEAVKKGSVLLMVEAMKMENNILAVRDGMIEELNVAEGDMVDGSKILLKLAEENEI
ncbi:MAG: acetyl-CoA carboxylase biotin carboxyl carrier protein subunit, partial [Bacteroidales bacterium]|nr:acetyl-CoA carboxylase biotin carboxyl carrier protein subunit [Bacteroidales bacterium]